MSDPVANLDLHNADAICEVFDQAAALYQSDPARRGCVDHLGSTGRCTFTGDLHDHRENFEKILRVAKLSASSDYHVVLQELSHADHLIHGMDLSYRTLAKAAALKAAYPLQVHHVLSNHELAQARGEAVMKSGGSQTEAFCNGLDYVFGDDGQRVNEAVARYVLALPLAVKTESGILCAHSLPSPRLLDRFDATVLDRQMQPEDITGPAGSAYLMIWGRKANDETADALAEQWGVDVFVLGHQHADMGYEDYGRRILVINSDHSHAQALAVDLSRRYTLDDLMMKMTPLAGIVLHDRGD
ncbi:hypothetical protein HED60_08010 [Planctomycetales bacterium ZRK34]|nr:hypothetical protein HED60_08010 [Planctomycetales bacterium ZRK34]